MMQSVDSNKLLYESSIKIYDKEVIIDPPAETHTITIILLHGLAMRATNFIKLFLQGSMLDIPGMRVVIPQCKDRYNTFLGKTISSWFDYYDLRFRKPFEESVCVKDIEESTELLRHIVVREIHKLKGKSEKVFLAGFSQGCGLALHLALSFNQSLGGIFALAGYYYPITQIHENNKDIPICIVHGTKDKIRPWEEAEITYKRLLTQRQSGIEIELVDTGHEYDTASIRNAFSKWMKFHTI